MNVKTMETRWGPPADGPGGATPIAAGQGGALLARGEQGIEMGSVGLAAAGALKKSGSAPLKASANKNKGGSAQSREGRAVSQS